MNFFNSGYKAFLAFLCGVCLIPSGRLMAQAAPGPLQPSVPPPPAQPQPAPKKAPEVEPRKTIAGYWKFNADESDDFRRKMESSQGPGGGPGGGMGGPGRRPGIIFPYPGGPGNGPYGGPGPGGGMGGQDDNRERLKDLVRPADSLAVDLKDSEVDLTNEHGDKLVIYTDGRKIEKSKNDLVQAISAHWNGSQLVTDEKSPQGRKMSRTLELSSDGRQFTETWNIETRRSEDPLVLRYVYDAANPDRR
jgi:hypothetical protein